MKKTGICPKCQGRDILCVEGSSGAYGSGNNIPLGLSIFSNAKVARYICRRCGFVEEWLKDPDLEKVNRRR